MPELREAGGTLGEAASGGARRQITIITAGWGSSGYYSRDLLESAGPKVFPVGTQMFLDHPTRTEEADRPERSVRDLAARISSTPRMVGDALVAEAQIFTMWRTVIDELAADIGVSIRAAGETEFGEAEGRQGPIVTSLTEGLSVDFVTRAGRGGKVGQMIESAREALQAETKSRLRDYGIHGAELREARNAGHWLESKIHQNFTEVADNLFGQGYLTREERIALSNAIGDALAAFNEAVATNVPHLYQRDPYADPTQAGVPVNEAAGSGRPTTQEDNVSDQDKRLSELEESVAQLTTRVTEAEADRDKYKTRAERAEDALLESKAERIISEALDAEPKEGEEPLPKLPARGRARAIEAAKAGKLPLTEDGKLDTDRLLERLKKAVKEEHAYLTEAGVTTSTAGRVSGMGPSSLSEGAAAGGEQTDKQLTEAFGRLGMSEDAAARAAQGR